MQIFFSHSGVQKPLVREIRKTLPDYINAWIDEEKLLIGDSLEKSLENAIKKETDYILLFVDSQSVHSKWVEKEIMWTLDQENKMDRIFLLPIVVEAEAWEVVRPTSIRERKYLKLEDYTEASVRALSKRITSELFALICRDINSLRSPANITKTSVIDRTDEVLNDLAGAIRLAVFGYREAKPLPLEQLRSALCLNPTISYNPEDFDTVMRKIIQNDLIPGLVYDGFDVYLKEEHYKWKGKIASDAKRKIARTATNSIRSGQTVVIDAGSTADEVARIICTRISHKSLFNISIITTSLSVANIFLETGTKLGYDDENSSFKLYIAGNRVRPNTLAVVALKEECCSALYAILEQLGGADLALLGVNGIHCEHGFTTHCNAEVQNKRALMKFGRRKLILGDSSKVGIVEQVSFGTFQDDIMLITDESTNPYTHELASRYPDKIILCK